MRKNEETYNKKTARKRINVKVNLHEVLFLAKEEQNKNNFGKKDHVNKNTEARIFFTGAKIKR